MSELKPVKPKQRGEKRPQCGSKERALQDIIQFVDHPDEPMVLPSIADKLAGCKNMDIAPSKLFEDGGRGIAVAQYLARRAQMTNLPTFVNDIYDTFEVFLEFALQNEMPPTIGAWAVWNGITLARMNQIEKDTNQPERAHAVAICKEVLRTFMEQAAWEAKLNPLLYFHAQKALYGIVEQSTVTVKVEDNTREIDADEMKARIVMLTQNEDGVFTVPE